MLAIALLLVPINVRSSDARCKDVKPAALAKQHWARAAEVPEAVGKVSPLVGQMIREQQEAILAGRMTPYTTFHGSYAPSSTQLIEYNAQWDAQKILYEFTVWNGVEPAQQVDFLVITKSGKWVLNPKGNEDPKLVLSSNNEDPQLILRSVAIKE